MEVTAFGLVRVVAAVAVIAVLLAALVALLRQSKPVRPISECLLGAMTLTTLILNAEVYALSLLPIDRPLRYLVSAHLVVIATTAVLSGLRSKAPGESRSPHPTLPPQGGGPLLAGRLRAGLVEWASAFAVLSGGCRATLASLSRSLRAAVWTVVGLVALYLLYGAYCVPGSWGTVRPPGAWDVLSHHLPMAVQPYQDQCVGRVVSNVPWATAYPRGSHMLWFWTLEWTGTDLLFAPVMLGFGLKYLLAIYVLARRTGVGAPTTVLYLVVAATMPVFFLLTTCGYIDLAVAAAGLTAPAFLAPPRQAQPLTRDWLLAAAGVAEACLIKFPGLAVALAGLVWLHAVLGERGWRAGLTATARFACSWRLPVAVLVVALGGHTYVRNWVEYGNPFYPIQLRPAAGSGGEEVGAAHTWFKGPLDARFFYDEIGHSTFGPVRDMPRWQRFAAAWLDVGHPLTTDSFGSLGPVYPLGVLVPFIAFAGRGLLRRRAWPACLAGAFAVSLFTPAFVPRYGLPVTALTLVGAARAVEQFPPRWRRWWAGLVLAFCAALALGAVAFVGYAVAGVVREAGGTLPLRTRNAFLYERYRTGPPGNPSPGVMTFLRARSGDGDALAWDVVAFHGLFWNTRYSNRVVYLPARERDSWPAAGEPLTSEELENWLMRLRALAPRHVLLYADSQRAARLRTDRSQGYDVAYEEPAGDERWDRMVVFERP